MQANMLLQSTMHKAIALADAGTRGSCCTTQQTKLPLAYVAVQASQLRQGRHDDTIQAVQTTLTWLTMSLHGHDQVDSMNMYQGRVSCMEDALERYLLGYISVYGCGVGARQTNQGAELP